MPETVDGRKRRAETAPNGVGKSEIRDPKADAIPGLVVFGEVITPRRQERNPKDKGFGKGIEAKE